VVDTLHDNVLEQLMMLKNEYMGQRLMVYYILKPINQIEIERKKIFFNLDIRQVLNEDLVENAMKQDENE
jgi:hypothetical protein